MATLTANRVAQAGTCAGTTGPVVLGAAIDSYRRVQDIPGIANGDTGDFLILGDDFTWEAATMTYNSGAGTLSRGTFLDSNTGSLINFTAATVAVFMSPTAAQIAAVKRGGTANQVLAKVDGTDFNTAWTTLTAAMVGATSSTWLYKTANYTAVAGDQIDCNTTGGSFTITLPATPADGDFVRIKAGPYGRTNNLTVARNGSTIMNLAEDMTVRQNNAEFTLAYSSTSATWRL